MMINRQYHCLISGLPDLSFDDSRPWISPPAFGKLLKEDLHPDDYRQVELVFLEYDNRNLTDYLVSGEMEDSTAGNYSINHFREQEELFSSILPVKDILPFYMVEEIRETRREDVEMDRVTIGRRLTEGYYNHIMNNGRHFLKAFTRFDTNLKNLVSFIKAGIYNFGQERFIMGDSEHAQHLRNLAGKNLIKDQEFEFFDEIVSYTGSSSFFDEEMKYDRLRWRVIEEMIFFEDFNIDRITAYLQQLFIVSRWADLRKDTGEKKLRQILYDASNYVENLEVMT